MEENKKIEENVEEKLAVVNNTAELQPVLSEEKPKKNKKGLIIGVICAAVVATVLLITMFVFMFAGQGTYKKIINLCEKGEYSSALDLWEESNLFGKAKSDTKKHVQKLAEEALENYKNDEIDFLELERIVEFATEICGEKDFLKQYNSLKKSKEIFDKGIDFANEQKYVESAAEFKKVPKGDPLYEMAQKNIEWCADKYLKVLLLDLAQNVFDGDYKKALSDIEAYEAMGGTDERVREYKEAFGYMKEDYENPDTSNFYKGTTAYTYEYVTGEKCFDIDYLSDGDPMYRYSSSIDGFYEYIYFLEGRGWYRSDSEETDTLYTYGLYRGEETIYVTYVSNRDEVWIS